MRTYFFVVLGMLIWGLPELSGAAEDCRNPADDADVIFDAKALSSKGTDTRMQVLRVSRGQIEGDKILFRHRAKTHLQDGMLYRIFAKQAPDARAYSELWGAPYCTETVQPVER